jgi:CheY-like chemotaxis protein
VEDNKTNQFIAKSILEQAGFVVIITSDGEEGYRYFAAHQKEIDLILMDLHMPVMDGYTSSDLIRKISKDIPIVAMTADAIAGVEEKCRSHGIWNYVSKPFEPDQLIETLITLMNEKEPKVQTERGASNSIAADTEHAVDFSDGIKRMGGDETIYRLVLQSFADENSGVEEELRSAIRSKNFKQGEQIVHKIKSSAGSIGAKNLHDAAAELQRAFKEENDSLITELSADFVECLTRTLLEIKGFIEL